MVELTSRSRRVLVGATIAVVAAGCVGAGVLAGRALDDGGSPAPSGFTAADFVTATSVPTKDVTRGISPVATATSAPRRAATPSEPPVTPSPVTTAEATVATQLSTPSSPPRGSASPPGLYGQGTLTADDLASRGSGMAGRGPLNADRIIITAAGADAELTTGAVGTDGQLPSAPNKDTAIWYDFANWPGLGGAPGRGGNIVIAGDAGRPGQGPGVFSRVPRLVPGDYIKLRGADTWCYRVEFNRIALNTTADYTAIVSATAEESVTLITAGRTQDERTIVWARTAACGAEPRPTPTRTPRTGHQQLHIVAEHLRFTLVEGDTIPVPVHTVDILFDNLDDGVTHHIVFDDPAGAEYLDDQEVGPADRLDGVHAGPSSHRHAAAVQLQCAVHPDTMRGAITVE